MKFRFFLTLVAVTLSVIGYLPIIYSGGLYSICRMGLFAVMAMLSVVTVFGGKFTSNRFIHTSFIIVACIGILLLAFYALGLNVQTGDLIQIIIPVLCTYIAYSMKLSQQQVHKIVWFYIILSILTSFISLNTYMRVTDGSSVYLIEGKNQIGAIISIATGLSFYLFCITKDKKRLFSLVCFIFALLLSFMIGCRTAFVGSILCITYTLYKTSSRHQLIIIATLAFVVCLIFFDDIYAVFIDFFIGDRIVTDANDLSTGRLERNVAGIEFLSSHLFEGELKTFSNIPLIHNYLLLRFVRYGIFALPFVMLYFLYLGRAAKELLKIKHITNLSHIGFMLLIMPFFNSLLEPNAPFGPGSVYLFSYLLFGYSLNITTNKHIYD